MELLPVAGRQEPPFRTGAVLDVVAVAGIVKDAHVAGVGVVHQVLLECLQDGVGGGILIGQDHENEVDIADGAVQVFESPVLGIAFCCVALDGGRLSSEDWSAQASNRRFETRMIS